MRLRNSTLPKLIPGWHRIKPVRNKHGLWGNLTHFIVTYFVVEISFDSLPQVGFVDVHDELISRGENPWITRAKEVGKKRPVCVVR
jgi:hypothetical protein